jgi:hypothetical protein
LGMSMSLFLGVLFHLWQIGCREIFRDRQHV